MISAETFAKVNLGLRVGGRRDDGYHRIDGIFQSVAVADRVSLAASDEDAIAGVGGRPVADDLANLAFRAADAVRDRAGSGQRIALILDKSIPAAAGLAGGSADAAAALAIAGRFFGVKHDVLADIAPQIGSDVPFCLTGGTARVSGRGEIITPMSPMTGFSLVIVVPPFEIATPAAFRTWDDLGEPIGLRFPQSALPPPLRSEGDLYNDLYPAAVVQAPELDDWRADLEQGWGRPVLLSGSGPSLFGFFVDSDEAAGAAATVPTGARFAESCDLVPVGWRITDDS